MTLVMLLLFCASLCAAQEQTETALAVVNGNAITQKDFDREFNRIKMQADRRQQPLDDSTISKIKDRILETLINRELLYQASLEKNIVLDDSEIDLNLEKIKQRLDPDKSFAQALAEIQVTEAEFRNEIKKAMLIQKLMEQEVYNKISISEKETRVFYDNNPQFFQTPEQIRASHILIKVDTHADDTQRMAAKKKIEEIRSRLDKGEDFAELAKEFSDCPSGKNGGDLGFFDRTKMVKPFSDAAFSLKIGEISGIVETQFGYHIIKVTEQKPKTKMNYEDVKERIHQTMRHQKIQEATRSFIDQLKKTASIQQQTP
jgi:peptidyl-prolyl cis-trans isomerase C